MYPYGGKCDTQWYDPNIEVDDFEREVPVDSTKIAISFVKTWELCDGIHVIVDDTFCLHVPQHLNNSSDSTTLAEAHNQSDWLMWVEAMRS